MWEFRLSGPACNVGETYPEKRRDADLVNPDEGAHIFLDTFDFSW
jgi:hypothetical protein